MPPPSSLHRPLYTASVSLCDLRGSSGVLWILQSLGSGAARDPQCFECQPILATRSSEIQRSSLIHTSRPAVASAVTILIVLARNPCCLSQEWATDLSSATAPINHRRRAPLDQRHRGVVDRVRRSGLSTHLHSPRMELRINGAQNHVRMGSCACRTSPSSGQAEETHCRLRIEGLRPRRLWERLRSLALPIASLLGSGTFAHLPPCAHSPGYHHVLRYLTNYPGSPESAAQRTQIEVLHGYEASLSRRARIGGAAAVPKYALSSSIGRAISLLNDGGLGELLLGGISGVRHTCTL
ncbi:hypothetical protein R3P38DRAFT_3294574 [Favolaschia claudopus]|uniref:Uncharacterized protein n=1 Tax=Favolaschia claudopus TaxID=2862362 RepID=A0AAV9ZCL7_9AGAR